VETIVGIGLPPAPIVHLLLDGYFKTFHWYITLFHEPSFRQELDPIISSGLAQQSQKPFLLLLFAVLLNSVQFCEEEDVDRACPGYDKIATEATWLKTVEQNIFSSFDELDLPLIGCLFIMTTIYLQRKRTPLALSLVAMTVRAAQSMNLHKEHTWGRIDDAVDREIRRMIWWSVFMSDGYGLFLIRLHLSNTTIQVQQPSIWKALIATRVRLPRFHALRSRRCCTYLPRIWYS
jgi:hypothetical protein